MVPDVIGQHHRFIRPDPDPHEGLIHPQDHLPAPMVEDKNLWRRARVFLPRPFCVCESRGIGVEPQGVWLETTQRHEAAEQGKHA
jgi:hypothetical protein